MLCHCYHYDVVIIIIVFNLWVQTLDFWWLMFLTAVLPVTAVPVTAVPVTAVPVTAVPVTKTAGVGNSRRYYISTAITSASMS